MSASALHRHQCAGTASIPAGAAVLPCISRFESPGQQPRRASAWYSETGGATKLRAQRNKSAALIKCSSHLPVRVLSRRRPAPAAPQPQTAKRHRGDSNPCGQSPMDSSPSPEPLGHSVVALQLCRAGSTPNGAQSCQQLSSSAPMRWRAALAARCGISPGLSAGAAVQGQDTLPEWSKGADSSSTSASCVGSNPTDVMATNLRK